MKIIIWLGCFFLLAIIKVFLGYMGVQFGAILTMITFCITFWIAKRLSQEWDEYKSLQKTKTEEEANE